MATTSRGCQELSRECEAGSKHMSTCQEEVKRVSREWQMDVNRDLKYVRRVPSLRVSRGCQGLRVCQSLGFLSRASMC